MSSNLLKKQKHIKTNKKNQTKRPKNQKKTKKHKALDFIGSRVRMPRRPFSAMRKPKMDMALDALAEMIISHVPAVLYNFQPKCAYLALMIRRVLDAELDRSTCDDKVV